MKKVLNKTETSFREKGSKFIGYLYPVKNKEEFEYKLENLKKAFPDATHHCYAWRINPGNVEEFAQDNGEPGGTAGLPMLNQLKSYEAVNAAVIVVRYYGGTNLGKSGLIEAYSRTAAQCLEQAELRPIQLIWKVKIEYPYPEQNVIEKLMHRFSLTALDSTYTDKVSLMLACPVQHKENLQNSLQRLEHRTIKADFLEKSYR